MNKQEINKRIELAILGVVINVQANPNGDYGTLIQETRKEIIKITVNKSIKIQKVKVKKSELRIKIAEGETDSNPFVVSVLATGRMGIIVEFDDESYLVPTEEIVKEIIKFRGKK